MLFWNVNFPSQGSVVGGFLAQPANKYSLFRVQFFCTFPYLLPCLVCIALSVSALTVTVIFIKETRPRKSNKQQKRRENLLVNGDSGDVPLESARLLDMEDFDSGTEMDAETFSTLSSSAGIQETSFTDDENCDVHILHSTSQASLSTSFISESSSLADNDDVENVRSTSEDQLLVFSEDQEDGDALLGEGSSDKDLEQDLQPVTYAGKMKQKVCQKLRTVASKSGT